MSEEVSFGDHVRVRVAPETVRLGIAEKQGTVFGITTPSVTGVEVVGGLSKDRAIDVFFDDLDRGYWLAEELVYFVDHGSGATITLEGVAKQWVRGDDGSWLERGLPPRKPWWRFWS